MSIKYFFGFALLALFVLVLSSCSFGNLISEPEYNDWKIKFGDVAEYAAPNLNDSD